MSVLSRFSIRLQLAAIFALVGLVSAAALFTVFLLERPTLVRIAGESAMQRAQALGEQIDSLMFERYGDVQAFALNLAAKDEANWRVPGPNPLVEAMNGYVAAYGIYPLMVVTDREGQVVAANSRDAQGRPVATAPLYGESLRDQPWFEEVRRGRFLLGRNGLTGTTVGPVASYSLLAAVTGGDGFGMAMAAPITGTDGAAIGYWVNFIDFGYVEALVANAHPDLARLGLGDTELTLLDQNGTVLVDFDGTRHADGYRRDPKIVGQLNLAERGVSAAQAVLKGETGFDVSTHARKQIEQLAGFAPLDGTRDFPGLGWSMLMRYPVAQAFAAIEMISWEMELAMAAAVILSILVGLVLGSVFAAPLSATAQAIDDLSRGDEAALPYDTRGDEIGRIARAYRALAAQVRNAFRLTQMVEDVPINIMTVDVKNNFTVDYLNKTIQETLRPLQAHLPVPVDQIKGRSFDVFHKNPGHQRAMLADASRLPHKARLKIGDETFTIIVSAIRDKAGQYVGAMATWQNISQQMRLADEFETSVMKVVDTVSSAAAQMQSSSQVLSTTADTTIRQSTAVAAAAEQASANVQTVASATEELTASINEISRRVQQSAEVAAQAVEDARRTDGIVQGLAQAAQKIGDVVRLISDIASQTNLLALNATIEAARAGEAGKGFAVVASEVKTLANQTSKATEDITSQIEAIQEATNQAVTAIQDIGKVILEVNEISTAIASAVQEQGAATREIAQNVQEASTGTSDVSRNIAGVTGAAGETGQASHQVMAAAGELAAQAGTLREKVSGFLASVRAA